MPSELAVRQTKGEDCKLSDSEGWHRRLQHGARDCSQNATGRPAEGKPYTVRIETPAGEQAQVDFAQFRVRFADAPDREQIVWLFSMVLSFSRLIWARFVMRQTMSSVLVCHRAAFEVIGG